MSEAPLPATTILTELRETRKELREDMRAGFQAVSDDFAAVNRRLDGLEAWRCGIDDQVAGLGSRVEQLEKKPPSGPTPAEAPGAAKRPAERNGSLVRLSLEVLKVAFYVILAIVILLAGWKIAGGLFPVP